MTDHIPVDKPVSIAVTELAEGKIRIHAAKETEVVEDEEMISEDVENMESAETDDDNSEDIQM